MTDFSWDKVPAEARAAIPQENHRRARLYDAIWDIAYFKGGLRLFIRGGHDTVYSATTGDGYGADGPMEHIERWITDQARPDVTTGPETWRCPGDPIECGYEAALGEAEEKIARLQSALSMLEDWDMLSLDSDGNGVAAADAAWARGIIRQALDL